MRSTLEKYPSVSKENTGLTLQFCVAVSTSETWETSEQVLQNIIVSVCRARSRALP
jgi:hypothetical protein